jgi:NTP pyrophosphatase (non-canonical NTP hydrolase)
MANDEHGEQAAQGNAPLTLPAAQRAVDASIQALGGYWPPLANLARLFEECGELARGVNQRSGPKPLKPGEAAASLEEELGDVLYITLVLANSLQLDAAAALDAALARAVQRARR